MKGAFHFLRAFGRHWILFTGSASYGALFDQRGPRDTAAPAADTSLP